MSSDSEEEVCRARSPLPTNTTATAGVDGEDNPVYHEDSDDETRTTQTQRVVTTTSGSNSTHTNAVRCEDSVTVAGASNTLAVNVSDRGRASSMRETRCRREGEGEGEEEGDQLDGLGPRWRSRSQPPEQTPQDKSNEKEESGSRLPKLNISISPKTQIGKVGKLPIGIHSTHITLDWCLLCVVYNTCAPMYSTSILCVGDNGGSTEGCRGESTADPPPASPVLAQYIADAKKKAEEVRKKTGQWSAD